MMNSASLFMAALLTSGQAPAQPEKGPPPATPGAGAGAGAVAPGHAVPGHPAPGAPAVVHGDGGCGPGCAGTYHGGFVGGAACGCDPCATPGKTGILSRLRGRFGGHKTTTYAYPIHTGCDGCGAAPAIAHPPIHPGTPTTPGTGTPNEMPKDPKKEPGKAPISKPAGSSQIEIPTPMVVPTGGQRLNGSGSPY